MSPKSTNSQYMDPRYGCSRCDNDNLPGLGYLDRLKRGTTLSKQQYSLQKHVETYHPDVTDWMSLKVDLGKVPRPGTRKRKAAQISRNDDQDKDEHEDDDNGDQGNGRDENLEADEDEDLTTSDSSDTRARKMARRTASTEPLRARPATRATNVSASTTTQSTPFVPTAVVPILPLFPGPIHAAETNVHTASVGDLREQNIQLATSIQDYTRVNDTLTRQVQGLLGALTNVVDEELHAYPLSTLAVQNALMHWTRADGQLVEQILGRVTTELHTRRQPPTSAPVHASGLAPRAAQPVGASQLSQSVALQSVPNTASPQAIYSSDSSLSDAPSDMEL